MMLLFSAKLRNKSAKGPVARAKKSAAVKSPDSIFRNPAYIIIQPIAIRITKITT
jgi:hypothetical protein